MSWVEQYFLEPMKAGSGYNVVNTLVLAILFYGLAVVMLKFFRKAGLKAEDVAKKALPFIFLGGVVRTLEDACVYPCGWPLKAAFITPGLYLLIIGVFIGLLLAEKKLRREFAYATGWVLLLANLAFVRVNNPQAAVMIIGFAALFSAVFFAAAKLAKLKLLLEKANVTIVGAHLFDASATFVGIDYFGYFEQHVLGGALIAFFGTGAAMVLLKAVAVPAIIYLCEGMEKEEKSFVKMLVLALGLGPGTRNFLSIVMGV